MRSNGLATFLLMIPVLAVPAMAIFAEISSIAPSIRSSAIHARRAHAIRGLGMD